MLVGRGLPFGRATGLGVRITEETVARSFVVEPRGLTSLRDISLPNLTQYRLPKLSGRVARQGFKFVEKSKYAINTPLEVLSIPGKAARLRKLGLIR